MPEIAIIGGTGIYYPKALKDIREVLQRTAYGQVKVSIGSIGARDIAFLPRHGGKHSVPPHLINYRANIAALHTLGVKQILASATVGSLNTEYRTGDFILSSQYLDFTRDRPGTFREKDYQTGMATSCLEPYCPSLRSSLENSGRVLGINVKDGAVYVCTEGPRFETPAEISMFRNWGGDLVGMTGVPEVTLANELGICYANLCLVSNMAAGLTSEVLNQGEIVQQMRVGIKKARKLLFDAVLHLGDHWNCSCPG